MPHGVQGAGKAGRPSDALVLSEHTYGHGASSQTTFRIDPVNELVIVQMRDRAGEPYELFKTRRGKLFAAIADSLVH